MDFHLENGINDYKELPNTPSNLNTAEPESNTYKQDNSCQELGQDNSSNLYWDLGGGFILREAVLADILRLRYAEAEEATVSEEGRPISKLTLQS